jgi:hypothetical protein
VANEVFQFRWQVANEGYEWRDGRLMSEGEGPQVRVLIERASAGPAKKYRYYDPLTEHPALFRTFADTPLTEAGVLAFAKKYGTLATLIPVDVRQSEGDQRGHGVHGEPWHLWREHLSQMRQMIDLWDMLRANDLEGLQRHVRWGQDRDGVPNVVVYDSHAELGPLAHAPAGPARTSRVIASSYAPQDLGQFRPGDVVRPGWAALRSVINGHLHGHTAAGLVEDPGSGESVLRLVPHDLQGCLWLQLAEAVNGHKRQRACEYCGTWFEVGAPTKRRRGRPNRQFCSVACRNKAYRQRQETARQLHAGGKTAKQIAKELGTDVETVKGWIKGTKG